MFLVKILAKFDFSYTFVQEIEFLDFCEGVCHYDVTEAEDWECWYFIWYQCLEETLSYTLVPK